eukprot:COSAG05_NODE_11233_length_523_cov_1.535377_1_plen_43_part_01
MAPAILPGNAASNRVSATERFAAAALAHCRVGDSSLPAAACGS